jgi:hypothetical protein
MYHLPALASMMTPPPLAASLAADLASIPDGFVKNRTLLIGFAVALVLAFFAKIVLRRHDQVQAERHEEAQEVAAVNRDGPPTFNG